MPKRHRSPSATATQSSAPSHASSQSGEQGIDNSLVQELVGGVEQETMGFLDSFDQSQAPPELEQVEVAEHREAIQLAVQESAPEQAVEAPAVEVSPVAAPAPARTPQPQAEQAPATAPAVQQEGPDLSATQAGGKGSRPLTPTEIEYAKRIYGDSIDYSNVRMTSDHWLSTGAPKTLGNTMHMRSEWGSDMFKEDGSLTAAGHDLLIHELGHVWQYQHGGNAYIGDSLWAQAKAAMGGDSRNGAYDWKAAVKDGLAWEDWNPEQQAEAIEAYHDIMQAEDRAQFSTSQEKEKQLLQPYIDKVRAGEGSPQFSTPGAVAGGVGAAAIGAGIGALVGGPVGALVGAGIGAIVGGWFGGG